MVKTRTDKSLEEKKGDPENLMTVEERKKPHKFNEKAYEEVDDIKT